MPTFYNFTENGVNYSFDDIFVPADLFRQGNLWTWGQGTFAQLGNNDATNRTTPVTTLPGGIDWKQVSAGYRHTAAIKTDGTLWTWGRGTSGELGNNDVTNRTTPVTTFSGGNNWKQVSAGTNYTAAIKTDGTLWIWGSGSVGRLGINATTNRSTPVTTFAGGSNWKQVSCGANHTASVKTDGTLWIWGYHLSGGKLGTNDSVQKDTPVTTFSGGSNWKQVSCGTDHTAAIKTDGTLWTWGEGLNGKLGTNETISRSTPVTTFAGGTNWDQVTCGDYHTIAIKTDGTLWIWGNGGNGRLGNNQIIDISTPITTFSGGTNWKQTDGGSFHTVAIKTDGTLWTWGFGSNGQLGVPNINGTFTRSTPITTFAGGTIWKQVSGGSEYTAAVTYEDPTI